MKKKSYKSFLRSASIALVRAQRPIRIISSIHIPDSVKKRFLARKFKRLPRYEYPPLRWNASQRKEMFIDIQSKLDKSNPIENIIYNTCAEYILTIRMLESRGTMDFFKYSKDLFGYPDYCYVGGNVSILDLANHIQKGFDGIEFPEDPDTNFSDERIDSADARDLLLAYLEDIFPNRKIKVVISNRMTADAAAGADYIKLKKSATYTRRQVYQLLHHEGEVHLATTLNGASQGVLKFLAKGTPRTTIYQEGLAVFAEFMSQQIDPIRVKKLAYRTIAIKMCEEGADFIDLYNFYLENNFGEPESFDAAARCIRGGLMEGGAPFTKDVAYLDGLVRINNFIRVALKKGRPELVRFLFTGKLIAENVPILYELSQKGIVKPPQYLPGWIKDMRYLVTLFNFSAFMDLINLSEVEDHYSEIMS